MTNEVTIWTAMAGMLTLSLFLLSVLSWLTITVLYVSKRLPKLTCESSSLATWGFIDIAVIVVAYFLITGVLRDVGISAGIASAADIKQFIQLSDPSANQADNANWSPTPEFYGRVMKLMSLVQLGTLAVVVLATLWICWRTRITWLQMGWSLRSLPRDLAMGLGALVLFAPPIMIVMGLATFLLKEKYDHPIIAIVNANPWLIGYAFLMAVIAAPLFEEFFFRVILQGFLQAIAAGRISARSILFGRPAVPVFASHPENLQALPASDVSSSYTNEITPYAIGSSLNAERESLAGENASPMPATGLVATWWPILTSSTLFGLAHFSYGVSWIPLILLGIVLGWLYHLTQRIWPCVVLHMAFNSISMLSIAAQALSAK